MTATKILTKQANMDNDDADESDDEVKTMERSFDGDDCDDVECWVNTMR